MHPFGAPANRTAIATGHSWGQHANRGTSYAVRSTRSCRCLGQPPVFAKSITTSPGTFCT